MSKEIKKSKEGIPFQVWILTLAVFAIGTAEFIIAGILPQISESLHISNGRAGDMITAYALAIVFGGPILTMYLAKFEKKNVLIFLMCIFIIGNIVSALSNNYTILLISRIISGLTQGPFFGIGAVVASSIAPKHMAGRAVGQMFAGLTLANVLGVPFGSWLGNQTSWNTTFVAVSILGIISLASIGVFIKKQGKDKTTKMLDQLKAFKNYNLIASLLITTITWTGFMTYFGYISVVAIDVAGFDSTSVPIILVIVGIGLVVGNYFGGKTADHNLRLSLIMWSALLIASLIIVGILAKNQAGFIIASFIFGVTSFANVPPYQMRVMKYGKDAPELSSTLNISAFNIANAVGGLIGGFVIDGFSAVYVPYIAAIIPIIGLLFIIWQENRVKNA